TPAQVLRLTGQHDDADHALTGSTRRRLGKWRYGTAAYKVDFLLDGPIPWTNSEVAKAATVHVAGSSRELVHASVEVAAGRMPRYPFVMVGQQQVADSTRFTGQDTNNTVVWTYAHVPHGYREP